MYATKRNMTEKDVLNTKMFGGTLSYAATIHTYTHTLIMFSLTRIHKYWH